MTFTSATVQVGAIMAITALNFALLVRLMGGQANHNDINRGGL